MRNTRLSGHGLRNEGAPFARDGNGWQRLWWPDGPEGVALCECGATSEVLPSDTARKRWHRDVHKLALSGESEA